MSDPNNKECLDAAIAIMAEAVKSIDRRAQDWSATGTGTLYLMVAGLVLLTHEEMFADQEGARKKTLEFVETTLDWMDKCGVRVEVIPLPTGLTKGGSA